MTAKPPCPSCRHAFHKGPCRRLGPSRCVRWGDEQDGGGFMCGVRPPCPCPWRTCACGAQVAVADADDYPDEVETILRGSAGDPAGTLAVRKMADGSLRARPLPAGEQPREGEWRAVDHDRACPKAAQRGVAAVTGA